MDDFPDTSEELSPRHELARARLLWRLALGLPFLYMGLALVIERNWFTEDSAGFWPMGDRAYEYFLSALGLCALAVQIVLIVIRRRFAGRLREARLDTGKVARLYWQRTLWSVGWCDVVSFLGLAAFLVQGEWSAFVMLCTISYLFYLQAFPRGRLLDA